MNTHDHSPVLGIARTATRWLQQGALALGLWLAGPETTTAQPLPHQFTGIDVAPDRSVTLSLDGSSSNLVPGLSGAILSQFNQMVDLYIVEASANLTDWTRLALLRRTNNDSSPLLFRDSESSELPHRFYRTLTNHLITSFPVPSGPFAVGTCDRVMVDPSRTGRYRYNPATNAFMVTFWYPAAPPGPGTLPGPRWNRRLSADSSFYQLAGADTRWAGLAPRLVGYRVVGAPLAASQERYPILFFSHCHMTHRSFSSHIAEELASHGYVVVAPDHDDCYRTEFPDGRYLAGTGSGDSSGRFSDFTFLLDEMARLNDGDPLFAGRLDLDRIGIYGLIYGGMVAEMCRRDARLKCVALLEAENLQVPAAGLQKPFLAMNHVSSPRLAQNQALFDKANANATWLQIKPADGFTFTDAAWGAEILWARPSALAIDACLVWFFDSHLKGEAPPFPANAEITSLNRK
ncbi:MAG TPA: hypothetical protein PKM73_11065 [Verrucomicrobiota bacterium]|nr:hypothetical protein [Verrucomicrobiota bacterium]